MAMIGCYCNYKTKQSYRPAYPRAGRTLTTMWPWTFDLGQQFNMHKFGAYSSSHF